MFPMGHIGMKKKNWKSIINMELNFNIQKHLLNSFYNQNYVMKNHQISRGDSTWYADQTILSQKIQKYLNESKNKVKLIGMPYQGIRLDRSMDFKTLIDLVDKNFSNVTDFLAFHSNFVERWDVTRKFLSKMFNNDTLNTFFSYYTDFIQVK